MKNKEILWVIKTTLFAASLVTVCFGIILFMMSISYHNETDIADEVIGTWKCIQFYKNQKSFSVPDSQEIKVEIEDGEIRLYGSSNASIFRGADRQGTYSVEGGNTLLIDMGGERWTCVCVITSDGLLRMTVSEEKVILYLKKG